MKQRQERAPGHRLEVADGGAEEGDRAGPAGRDRAQVALEVAKERLDPQDRVLAEVAGRSSVEGDLQPDLFYRGSASSR